MGKTPLLKMDIPTGDSPPVSQKPYTLALKHVQWVREEIAGEGRGNCMKHITLGESHSDSAQKDRPR